MVTAPQVNFYTDEHVAKAVAKGLRRRGVDVLTASEAGMLSASDEDHLARARLEARVLVTHDDDFLRLHASGLDHAGIAYAPRQMSIGEVIYGLMLIQQVLEAEEMLGHVEYL